MSVNAAERGQLLKLASVVVFAPHDPESYEVSFLSSSRQDSIGNKCVAQEQQVEDHGRERRRVAARSNL